MKIKEAVKEFLNISKVKLQILAILFALLLVDLFTYSCPFNPTEKGVGVPCFGILSYFSPGFMSLIFLPNAAIAKIFPNFAPTNIPSLLGWVILFLLTELAYLYLISCVLAIFSGEIKKRVNKNA